MALVVVLVIPSALLSAIVSLAATRMLCLERLDRTGSLSAFYTTSNGSPLTKKNQAEGGFCCWYLCLFGLFCFVFGGAQETGSIWSWLASAAEPLPSTLASF